MDVKKKILVIDDSAFMRRVISDIITSDSRCEVIGVARNGEDGLEKIQALKPDVITLDIEMPIMTGLEMLEQLKRMSIHVPAIVMSTLAMEGKAETIQALGLGAIDFVTKPQNIFKVNTEEMREALIAKILMAACADVNKLVSIGCSTGGPRALQYVLPYLPDNLDAGIVIVQHMPVGFTKSLADRLNQLSAIEVKEAEDNDVIEKGKAYIAPGSYHMKIIQDRKSRLVIKLSSEEPLKGHRPAVDVMMNSLADIRTKELVGVIMTGMGVDGSEGLKGLKDKKAIHIIAQNEETSVVYGMPKAVVKMDIADEVVPLEAIADAILKKVGVL